VRYKLPKFQDFNSEIRAEHKEGIWRNATSESSAALRLEKNKLDIEFGVISNHKSSREIYTALQGPGIQLDARTIKNYHGESEWMIGFTIFDFYEFFQWLGIVDSDDEKDK